MKKIYINPLPVRIWHWINAFGFLLLILTGLQIRYVGQIKLLSFKTAVDLHNWIGFVLIANFFIWLGFYLFTDKIKVYHPDLSPRNFFTSVWRQAKFYGYGIFLGDPNPFHATAYKKFNPLQTLMYQIVMIWLVPLQFATGVLLFDVAPFTKAVNALGGVRVVDTVHVLLFIFFCSFLFIHVYLSSLGHTWWAHFEAMITGYEEVEEPEAEAAKV
jgi:thiosulfate reductase cytochrome b subunit